MALQPVFKSNEEKAEYERLRSHYAGCALRALDKRVGDWGTAVTPQIQKSIAETAYGYADAMMQASKQFQFAEADE